MDAKPRILTATAHRGEPIVRELLHSHAEVIAVESLDAVFVDRHELQRKHGETEGDVLFRRIVLGHGRR